jgi:hypothetical protein
MSPKPRDTKSFRAIEFNTPWLHCTHHPTSISDKANIPLTDKFYINGQWVAPIGRGRIAVINPATETTIAELSMGSTAGADAAVAAARRPRTGRRWIKLILGLRDTSLLSDIAR